MFGNKSVSRQGLQKSRLTSCLKKTPQLYKAPHTHSEPGYTRQPGKRKKKKWKKKKTGKGGSCGEEECKGGTWDHRKGKMHSLHLGSRM